MRCYMKLFVIIVVVMCLFVGCNNYAITINASSNSECVAQCSDVMYSKWCDSAYPSFMHEYGSFGKNVTGCDCALIGYMKK